MPIIPTPPVQGAPPAIRSAVLRDFTGGLNYRDDSLQLAPNEVASAIDVDLSAQGGFQRRKSFRTLASTELDTTTPPRFLFNIAGDNNDGLLFVGGRDGSADDLSYFSTFSDNAGIAVERAFTHATTLGQTWSGALMKRVEANGDQNLYIHRDYQQPVQAWETDTNLHTEMGDPAASSGAGWNEDFAAPVGGFMPFASLLCAHHEYMFHADTNEDSTRHDSRIRWSHPGHPGDYRENDFIDVGEGQDNDRVTAMVSAFGALFIFKQRSVWMLSGYDTDSFSIERIATGVGAGNKNAATSSQYGVAFFDQNLGVHEITYMKGASGRTWIAQCTWQKLNPAITDKRITNTQHACMTWVNSKLYVSGLCIGGATVPNVTYVHDEQVSPAWWAYGVGFTMMCSWAGNNTPEKLVGVGPCFDGTTTNYDRVAIFDLTTSPTDSLDGGFTELDIAASLQTAWVAAGDPSLKKRFRRFSLVFDNLDISNTITVYAYKDWKTPNYRSYTIAGDWDGFSPIEQKNVRGGTIGTAYSASLVIQGPSNVEWGVNMITLRYIPQRIV